jgi:hypothetical protein
MDELPKLTPVREEGKQADREWEIGGLGPRTSIYGKTEAVAMVGGGCGQVVGRRRQFGASSGEGRRRKIS